MKLLDRARKVILALSAERVGVQQMEQVVMAEFNAVRHDEADTWREALDLVVDDAAPGKATTARRWRERLGARLLKVRMERERREG